MKANRSPHFFVDGGWRVKNTGRQRTHVSQSDPSICPPDGDADGLDMNFSYIYFLRNPLFMYLYVYIFVGLGATRT